MKVTYDQLVEVLGELQPYVLDHLIIDLLKSDRIDFARIAMLHVDALQQRADADSERNAQMAAALAMTWKSLPKTSKARIRAAKAIVNAGVFDGTPLWHQCSEFLKEKDL